MKITKIYYLQDELAHCDESRCVIGTECKDCKYFHSLEDLGVIGRVVNCLKSNVQGRFPFGVDVEEIKL